MSGHSKWHNIQAKKGKNDAKKGKIFTKIGRELILAARDGGSSPETNSKLRDVIAKAKAANMPNDTIERAIKKGAGELEGINYEEIVYEGYAPGGVAVMVKFLTDNRNRSAASARHIFDKYGGNLGANGCVSYMFQRKGQMIIERTEEVDEEELMMQALEVGAEDFNAQDEVFEVITDPLEFSFIREELEKLGYSFIEADITMIPDLMVSVDIETAPQTQKLLDMLEDDDDVQNIYHNAEFPEEWEG